MILTAPTLGLDDYPASARAFTAAYERAYGPPEPASILGYEAMSLMLTQSREPPTTAPRPRCAPR